MDFQTVGFVVLFVAAMFAVRWLFFASLRPFGSLPDAFIGVLWPTESAELKRSQMKAGLLAAASIGLVIVAILIISLAGQYAEAWLFIAALLLVAAVLAMASGSLGRDVIHKAKVEKQIREAEMQKRSKSGSN